MKDPIFKRLLELHPKFSDLSLTRINKLLKKLNFNEKKLPQVIHIAGTNGKGSTASILKSILNEHGKTTHVYSTPHLVRFNERVQLYSKDISDKLLLKYLYHCEKVNQKNLITYFEITTAAALMAFQDHPADFLILEVGLGGRFDATNIIRGKKYSLITPISMDHQDYLGNSLLKIAFEKLSIFNNKSINFINYQKPTVKRFAKDFINKKKMYAQFAGVDWKIRNQLYIDQDHKINLKYLSLKGYHQFDNAGLAIAAVKSILKKQFDSNLVENALPKIRWAGRLQKIESGKLTKVIHKYDSIFLDGFHNTDGVKVFINNLKGKNNFLICSFLINKNYKSILKLLEPYFKKIFVTPMEEENSIQVVNVNKTNKINTSSGLLKSIDDLNRVATSNSTIYFGGSLYFIGEVLKFNKKK